MGISGISWGRLSISRPERGDSKWRVMSSKVSRNKQGIT